MAKMLIDKVKLQQGVNYLKRNYVATTRSFKQRIETVKNTIDNSSGQVSWNKWNFTDSETGDYDGYSASMAAAANSAITDVSRAVSVLPAAAAELGEAADELDGLYHDVTNFERDSTVYGLIDALENSEAEMSETAYADLFYYASDGKASLSFGGDQSSADEEDTKASGGEGDEGSEDKGTKTKDNTKSSGGGGTGSRDDYSAGDKDDTTGTNGRGNKNKDDENAGGKEGTKGSGGKGKDGKDDNDTGDKENTDSTDGNGGNNNEDENPGDKENTDGTDGNGGKDNEDENPGDKENTDSSNGSGGNGNGDSDVKDGLASIINASRNGSDDIGGNGGKDFEKTGASISDDTEWGLAGATALIAGMSSLGDNGIFGADSEYLSNLANGLDGSRTLGELGLDVFEHPDYTSDGGLDPNTISNDLDGEGYADGEYSEDGSSDGVADFEMKDSKNLTGNGGRGRSGGSGDGDDNIGLGVGALLGAAALGAGGAGGFMAMEDDSGGSIGGYDLYGNPLEDNDSWRSKLFGPTDYTDDEEEKKRQSLKEKISVALLSGGGLSSIVTFIISNLELISPLWFLLAYILFLGAAAFFEIVRDDKNKKREQMSAAKQINSKPGYFDASLMARQKSIGSTVNIKPVDWVLFGMVLLSSSAFVMKAFDVINWLIFLLLLLLFILIIVVYIILKKKLGEDNQG